MLISHALLGHALEHSVVHVYLLFGVRVLRSLSLTSRSFVFVVFQCSVFLQL